MKDDIASLAYPVFSYGVQLKEKLDRGLQPDLDQEQANLKALLLSDTEARRLTDFGGEGLAEPSVLGGAGRLLG